MRISAVCLVAVLALGGPAATLAEDAAAPAGGATAGGSTRDFANSVVKVFATVRRPDPVRPWTKQAPAEVTGSGAVIDGQRILTNAHVVLYASQVQIQANRAGDKVLASVVAIAPGIDLAVLKVDEPSFFQEHAALPPARALPKVKDAVYAYGFPTGGNSLSITKGIVSRIEFVNYNVDAAGLRIQIDAAINPGNSGGPVVADDKMIGLAFGTMGNNIGYIIPEEEIQLFLDDIADGHYDGKPEMHDELQTLENKALRQYLALDKSVHGIVVHRPYRNDSAYPLKEWDVITAIGATPIDDQGMVTVGDDLRVRFQYLIQAKAKNGTVPLTVVRKGKSLNVELPVDARRKYMVNELAGAYPQYFIYGPLVFSVATLEHLQTLAAPKGMSGMKAAFSALQSPLVRQVGLPPTAERDEIVIVTSPFFPDKLTAGYDDPAGAVVGRINGKAVRSLRQLVGLLRDLSDDYVVMEFEQAEREALVFARKDVLASTEAILADNGIRAQASPELLRVWQNQPAK